MKFLACFAAMILGISLSGVKSLEDSQIKTLSILGWIVALLFAKGGV